MMPSAAATFSHRILEDCSTKTFHLLALAVVTAAMSLTPLTARSQGMYVQTSLAMHEEVRTTGSGGWSISDDYKATLTGSSMGSGAADWYVTFQSTYERQGTGTPTANYTLTGYGDLRESISYTSPDTATVTSVVHGDDFGFSRTATTGGSVPFDIYDNPSTFNPDGNNDLISKISAGAYANATGSAEAVSTSVVYVLD